MSWEQLISISREAAALAQQEDAQPPEACPNDGEPLSVGPRGERYCRYDGWRPG